MRERHALIEALAAIKAQGREECDGPWRFTLDGREWVGATDGRFLLAVSPEHAPTVTLRVPEPLQVAMSKWTLPREQRAPTDAGTLKRFAGLPVADAVCERCRNTRLVTCRECSGALRVYCECAKCGYPHDAECDECDGTGKRPCGMCGYERQSPASIMSQPFDRRWLHRVLDAVGVDDAESVQISTGQLSQKRKDEHCLVIFPESKDWIALVMGLRATETTVEWEKPETWTPVPATA